MFLNKAKEYFRNLTLFSIQNHKTHKDIHKKSYQHTKSRANTTHNELDITTGVPLGITQMLELKEKDILSNINMTHMLKKEGNITKTLQRIEI